jgi:hypothetical protein
MSAGEVADLRRVSAGLRRLDELAEQHPELIGPGSADEWEEILAKAKATEEAKQAAAFRLDAADLAFLDAEAERMGAALPGMTFNRTDVLRVLIRERADRRKKEGKR